MTDSPPLFGLIPLTTHEELPPPENGAFYVGTKNGIMVHRRFHFGRVLVPIKEATGLPETNAVLWTDFEPKLPASLIGQAYSFFKAIYEARHSEAMVDITWHRDHGYRLFVPPQTASMGGVEAHRNPEHYVGQTVGTIHSHCDFDAYHSGTDTHDAEKHDGLHITIGDVLKKPSIAVMISVQGIRWDLQLEQVADGPLELHDHPKWWEKFVEHPAATQGKKKTAASASGTNYPTIIGRVPAHQVPTPRNTSLSNDYGFSWLGGLLLQYSDQFSPQEAIQLQELDKALEWVKDELAKFDIEMDNEFIPVFRSAQTMDDDTRIAHYLGGL